MRIWGCVVRSGRRSRRTAALLVAGAAASLAMLAGTALADTPTYGGGDCWRPGTPTTCRTSWQGKGTEIYYKLVDHFSGQRSVWYGGVDQARYNWSSAPGPQLLRWGDYPGDTWDYLEYSSTGDHGNTSSTYAITWSCDNNGYCSDLIQAMNMRWSSIWLNHNTIDGTPPSVFINVVAHELGHTMGLAHNTDYSRASVMHPVADGTFQAPQGDDIGNTNLCGYPPPGGVRCVFGSVGGL